jgi:hypothetical protein
MAWKERNVKRAEGREIKSAAWKASWKRWLLSWDFNKRLRQR